MVRDNVLMVAKLAVKLRKTKRGEEGQWSFDTDKLKNTNTAKSFKLNLQNHFRILHDEQR